MKNFRHISKAVYIDITNTLTIVSLRYSALIFIRYSICNLILKKLNTINTLSRLKKNKICENILAIIVTFEDSVYKY